MPVNTRSTNLQNSIIEGKNSTIIDGVSTTNNAATDSANDSAILISTALNNINKIADLTNAIKKCYQDILNSKTKDSAVVAAKNSAANYALVSITEQTARVLINATEQSIGVSIESYNAVKSMISIYKINFDDPYSYEQTTLIQKIAESMDDVINILLQTSKDTNESVQSLLNDVQNVVSNSTTAEIEISSILETHKSISAVINTHQTSAEKIKTQLTSNYQMFRQSEVLDESSAQADIINSLQPLEDELLSIIDDLSSKMSDIECYCAQEELLTIIKKNMIISTNEDKNLVKKCFMRASKNMASIKTLAVSILESYNNAINYCLDSLSLLMQIRNSYSEILLKKMTGLSALCSDITDNLQENFKKVNEIFEKYSIKSPNSISTTELEEDKKILGEIANRSNEHYLKDYDNFTLLIDLFVSFDEQNEHIDNNFNLYNDTFTNNSANLVKQINSIVSLNYVKSLQNRIRKTYLDATSTTHIIDLMLINILFLTATLTLERYFLDTTTDQENLINILNEATKLHDNIPSLTNFTNLYNNLVVEVDKSAPVSILEEKRVELLTSLEKIKMEYIYIYDDTYNKLGELEFVSLEIFERNLDEINA